MFIETLLVPLSRVPIFHGLRRSQLIEIAKSAERAVIPPGEIIIAQDEEGTSALVIVAGDAVCVEGPGIDEIAVPIEPGSMLAEMAMLTDHVHGSTVMARGRVRVLELKRERMHALMQADPSLAEHFVAVMSERLRAVAEDLRGFGDAIGGWDDEGEPDPGNSPEGDTGDGTLPVALSAPSSAPSSAPAQFVGPSPGHA